MKENFTNYAMCGKCPYSKYDFTDSVYCNRAPWDKEKYGCPKSCVLEIPDNEIEKLEGDVREWCQLHHKKFHNGYILNGKYAG